MLARKRRAYIHLQTLESMVPPKAPQHKPPSCLPILPSSIDTSPPSQEKQTILTPSYAPPPSLSRLKTPQTTSPHHHQQPKKPLIIKLNPLPLQKREFPRLIPPPRRFLPISKNPPTKPSAAMQRWQGWKRERRECQFVANHMGKLVR